MSVTDTAKQFLAHLQAGDVAKAEALWSDDVVSRESLAGPMETLRGRKAVHDKGLWWYENHQVNSFKAEGPYMHGAQFALVFTVDVTSKLDGKRVKMTEVALYKVKSGKIVEERFFN